MLGINHIGSFSLCCAFRAMHDEDPGSKSYRRGGEDLDSVRLELRS